MVFEQIKAFAQSSKVQVAASFLRRVWHVRFGQIKQRKFRLELAFHDQLHWQIIK